MVVAFYFRLHLAYFPRPVVAIFARPEQYIENSYLITLVALLLPLSILLKRKRSISQ